MPISRYLGLNLKLGAVYEPGAPRVGSPDFSRLTARSSCSSYSREGVTTVKFHLKSQTDSGWLKRCAFDSEGSNPRPRSR